MTFLNIQRDGPELKPDERIANSLEIQSKARSESKRIESLSCCSFSISNFEIKNPNAHSSCGCGVSVNFDMDRIPHFME